MSESQKCKAFDLCALWQQTWWCDTLGNRHVGNGGWHGGVRIEDDVRVLHGACDEATQQAVSSHGHMNKRALGLSCKLDLSAPNRQVPTRIRQHC